MNTDSLPNRQQFAEYLKQQLAEKYLSARAAAIEMGISVTFFSKMVRGEGNLKSVHIANRIADFFQTPRSVVYEMLGWATPTQQSWNSISGAQTEELAADSDFGDLVRAYRTLSIKKKRLLVAFANLLATNKTF